MAQHLQREKCCANDEGSDRCHHQVARGVKKDFNPDTTQRKTPANQARMTATLD
jgi:hypothetical protein